MNSQIEDYQFVAKLGNLKTVVLLLRCVNFRENAMCFASDNGLKITVEDSKCIQANAYLPSNVFQEYDLKEEAIFRINLTVLVECLGMFWSQISSAGTSVALQIYYKGHGHPVTVLIEEDGIITDCSLKTQEPEELLDFQILPDKVLNKVILQTELLRDIWSELDPTCEFVELLLSPNPPYFQIGTDGLAGECRIELPHDSDLVDSFDCKNEASFYYRFSHMKPAMKALGCANKVSLRTNDVGLLCFQYMVKTDEGHTCYVEYYLSPLLDTDE
ncbi:cell cycle checkpoint protein RAD1 [Fopius arisanus]|uniref:Cell cycle checkpoint protein RAD1 n=1 Tax=Fopius arisanus TaxID=64838 RepID=A0A9R1T7C9_9HYME|nr:PREDICTED: cell cycle checkpoint protein RAD1 [Fopius arisanus]